MNRGPIGGAFGIAEMRLQNEENGRANPDSAHSTNVESLVV